MPAPAYIIMSRLPKNRSASARSARKAASSISHPAGTLKYQVGATSRRLRTRSPITLSRSAATLSGGEAQRIRLAAQLGSNLRGVCYILDEPTIGLHPRDNRMMLDTLGRLEGKGNTIVVVEHDEDTIRRAGHVIDLGPGAGVDGGDLEPLSMTTLIQPMAFTRSGPS